MNKSPGAEVERLKTFSHNMKKILFALAMLTVVLPALPRALADEVSIDFFYNNLSGGNWIDVEGYGYGWQPDVAVNDPNWRPYADGYWGYTDEGWTWVSYEDFGWATYHYGRWAKLADYGWIWFLGSDLDWGPAWVSWRTGGDYVGWAPLPPRGPGIVYEGQPIGGRVDIEFDIGPAYYNFIDARFIGEPVLRDRIYPWSQNVNYINNTVNVTNITVQNNVVYNYGPDYNVLSARSSRPIQRLTIERQPGTNLSLAAKSGALTKVQGGKLMVAAPQKINKAAPGIVPPKVKAKVAQDKVEHGWTGVPNEAQLKQKIKTANPKNIPPPTGTAATGQAVGAASPTASPGGVTSPAGPISPSPFEKGKGRGKPGGKPQPGATGAPLTSPAGAVSPAIQGSPFGRERGKPGKSKPGELGTTPTPPTGVPTEGVTTPFPGKQKGKQGKPAPPEFTPSTGAPTGAPEATQPPGPPGKHKGGLERGIASPTPSQPGGFSNIPEQGRHKGRAPEQTGAPSPSAASESQGGRQRGQGAYEQPGGAPATGAAPGEARGGRQKGQGAYGQPSGAPGGGPPTEPGGGQGKPEGGKKKGGKASPTPGPG
ncbi:MAG: hypothetical protein DME75_13875 [Verrucomicrobia bacterium]|nr:MAG: hypothetical protein DME75_13875 [Verrucomicrobiota bacterium]